MFDQKAILDEVTYLTSRSKGKGGQHVNKVESKVILVFDLNTTSVLQSEQIDRIHRELGNKITRGGKIQIVAQKYRSQHRNRSLANQKLVALIKESLRQKKKRKKTGVSLKQKEKRLEEKKKRSQIKENRRKFKA